jgi:hypothetical protein
MRMDSSGFGSDLVAGKYLFRPFFLPIPCFSQLLSYANMLHQVTHIEDSFPPSPGLMHMLTMGYSKKNPPKSGEAGTREYKAWGKKKRNEKRKGRGERWRASPT